MSFSRRCIRCGDCTTEEVARSRFDCSSCKLTWFPEEGILGRWAAYVDKSKEVKRFVEVPEGCMLVFDVGRRSTSVWVSRGMA